MTTLPLFLAPPPAPHGALPDAPVAPARPRGAGGPALRMTRGARAAAVGMHVSDADVQACLDDPQDVIADRKPGCTRFRRGRLTVVTGPDGVVLRVNQAR